MTETWPQIYLASSSPRRRELLKQLGVSFTVLTGEVDETPGVDESARVCSARLASLKAQAVAQRMHQGLPKSQWKPVLAADTLGELDGELLLKATDEQVAYNMLASIAGRTHRVVTSVCVISVDDRELHASVATEVEFKPMSREAILYYLSTGEWRGKAGCYAIQGLAARWVRRISGSYTGVVGLPLCETAELLDQL